MHKVCADFEQLYFVAGTAHAHDKPFAVIGAGSWSNQQHLIIVLKKIFYYLL